MKRRDFLKTTVMLGCLAGVPMLGIAAETDPFQWVLQMSNKVLDEIKSNEALRSGDIPEIKKLVDSTIMPNVDFTMVTRMTVGPEWRQASPEQRQQLMDNFRELLIRVYAGALSKVNGHVAELVPVRNNKVSDEMVIRTTLKAPGQQPIAMDYRIYRDKAGDWKIVDVNVEGIWMVENYRSQFASVLSQSGIDGLISELKKRIDNEKGSAS